MENDFLDGIDEAFQSLMERSGNGKRNGHMNGRSRDDRVVAEIIDHLQRLSNSQKEEVLKLVRSFQKPRAE
jgi:hypothetical protein